MCLKKDNGSFLATLPFRMVFNERLVKTLPALFEYEFLLPCPRKPAIGTSSETMWHEISPNWTLS